MELSDKIKLILESTSLTSSIFADEIGVQRSSISHILAGRNKPSLDVVQKIIKRFPDFGVNWILEDENLPILSKQPNISKSMDYQEKTDRLSYKPTPEVLTARTTPQKESKETNVMPPKTTVLKERTAVKLMVLYSDGTFQEFNPSNPMF